MLTAKGLAKLAEECGELIQVIGKKLAYYTTEEHPDGGRPLKERLEDEIADVLAACSVVMDLNGLDREKVNLRCGQKLALFHQWHKDAANNRDGIDAVPGSYNPLKDLTGIVFDGGKPIPDHRAPSISKMLSHHERAMLINVSLNAGEVLGDLGENQDLARNGLIEKGLLHHDAKFLTPLGQMVAHWLVEVRDRA